MNSLPTGGPRPRVTDASVLDASAFIALLNAETGWQTVAEALPTAIISAVNLSEVVAKSVERGLDPDQIRTRILAHRVEIIPFESETAFAAGNLRTRTMSFGLSLGDRACLALALSRSYPVITADRIWATLDIGVEVRLIR